MMSLLTRLSDSSDATHPAIAEHLDCFIRNPSVRDVALDTIMTLAGRYSSDRDSATRETIAGKILGALVFEGVAIPQTIELAIQLCGDRESKVCEALAKKFLPILIYSRTTTVDQIRAVVAAVRRNATPSVLDILINNDVVPKLRARGIAES